MRKLLFILSVLIMVSCCPTESVNTVTKIPATRIDIPGTGSYLYQFTYKGHDYITNSGCDFIRHIPSCPCKFSERSILNYE